SIYQLLSFWTPRSELGLAFGLIQASGYIGAVLTMPICAFLSQSSFAGGWPSVFYVFGLVGVLFLLPWLVAVYDAPDLHPTISDQEYVYIKTNVSVSRNAGRRRSTWVPWCAI